MSPGCMGSTAWGRSSFRRATAMRIRARSPHHRHDAVLHGLLSKQFTAAAVLSLVADGKSRSMTMCESTSRSCRLGKRITLEHLLHHERAS
jgi:CubicO group peptidase (beta-lactamase class C family)